MIAERTGMHAVQAFVGERLQKKMLRGNFTQAARAQIEKSGFVHLADGRAVRTFYVVSVDLQLRFGVDLGIIAKQKIAIGLLGVSFLGVLVHDDAPMENTARLPVQNAVVELAAVAMRAGMLHEHVVIHVLSSVGHEQAVDQALRALSSQYGMNVVADQSPAQKQ